MTDPEYSIPPDLVRHHNLVRPQSPETWHLPRHIFDEVRKVSTGKGIKVAVLDTGYTPHETLPDPLTQKSFTGEPVRDRNGHGNHCAGTILSRDKDIGLAPEADLIPVKVLSDRGSGSSSGIAAGIKWAVEQGADILSLSLGGSSRYEPTVRNIKEAINQGVVVCCAAGNSGFNGRRNTIGYPAKAGESICVGALKSDFTPASFSSGGEQMTQAAPGQQILSTGVRGSDYVFMSGTSMATPYVAGSWALILSYLRSLGYPSFSSLSQINNFVKKNATDLLSPGHDPATGFGMFSMLEVLTNLAKNELVLD